MSNLSNKDSLSEKIQDYVHRRGFGSMNKNDFEVFIFYELLKTDEKCKDKSDFVISRYLRIPESKVKRLRYEANLVYSSDSLNEVDSFKDDFYKILKDRVYKTVGEEKIQFSITDKMLRLYLDDKLESFGSYADSSFNSNIVTITASDLILLISDFENKKDVLEIVKKSLDESEVKLPKNWETTLKDGIAAVVRDLGGKIAPNVVKFITENARRMIDTIELEIKKSEDNN